VSGFKACFRVFHTFRTDERGAVLVYVTLLILAIVALLSVSIDGARLMYLNSNLQEIADAAALASAKELDGRADAITRANTAAVNFLDNHPEWSDIDVAGAQIVAAGDDKPVFFSALDPDVPTSDPRRASFVRVTTVVRGVNLTFGKSLMAANSVATRAQATARSVFSECASIQSFLCNPWESEQSPSVAGGALNWVNKVTPGQMFVLAGGSGGAEGNWGLIDPPGGSGHNPHDQAAFWAEIGKDNCSLAEADDIINYVDPGNNASAARPGMNVRFDNPVNGLNNTSAPVVIDGYRNQGLGGYGCQNNIPTDADGNPPPQTDTDWPAYQTYCRTITPRLLGSCPLPRDRDLAPVSGANPALTRSGSGVNPADLDAYWINHHSGTRPQALDTRYKIYQCEADPGNAAKCFGASGNFTARSEQAEEHAPQCQVSTVGDASRRMIRVALVDCEYWGITGASQPLPVFTLMAEFFMTEPAETSQTPSLDGRLYGELVRTYTVNSEGSGLYHIVQLVR
jgi:hypothetical protein